MAFPQQGGPLGALRPPGGPGLLGMPQKPPAPAPGAPAGPTAAPTTPAGGGPGKTARAAVGAGAIMKACIALANGLDPMSDEARALMKAYGDLAKVFKPANGPLEQSELAALGRGAGAGPGVMAPQQQQAMKSAISQMQPPKAA